MLRLASQSLLGGARSWCAFVAAWILPLCSASALEPTPEPTALALAAPAPVDYSALSIEELMQVKLSLSRTDETLLNSPSAAYIVTADEIRRSGATSVPEALRGVPGLEVARVDPHTWAVTARGFNDTYANKLLVMIDGRTIYTPLFSGVFWDAHDMMLEDVDHIEVVRGPGGTLWGANAVNGVINIVTKTAAQTQGTLVSTGVGTGETGFGSVRHGGRLSDQVHYRAYMKLFSREDMELVNGSPAGDWDAARGGLRLDWTPGADAAKEPTPDILTLQGDLYDGRVGQYFNVSELTPAPRVTLVRDVVKMSGGYVLGRWTHEFSDDATMKLQASYDRSLRNLQIFNEQRDTFDVDFQNQFSLGPRNAFIWGAGYRFTSDETSPTSTISLEPTSRDLHVASFFAQDEITLVERKLRLTLGTKVEHNDFTGWEIQPGGRMLWTPATNQSAWASISRAVRTPSRAEDDIRVTSVLDNGLPVRLLGDRGMQSEKLIAYELGYRIQPVPKVSFDAATFFNDYHDLRTLELAAPAPDALVQRVDNRMKGNTYGVELGANWDVLPTWKLRGSYTWLRMDLDAETHNLGNEIIERSSPRHQVALRSSHDLPFNLEFDVTARYVDSLETQNFGSATSLTKEVPSYVSLDVRLAWRPRHNLEIAVVGQNLIEEQHREFNPSTIRGPSADVRRSVYGKVTWQF